MNNKRNEEKAKELFKKYFDSDKDANSVMLGALEMAEWKDHQFKEYLEKKKAAMKEKHNSYNSAILKTSNSGGILTIDEIINELFGE